MKFSIWSMLSNSAAFRKTMTAKQMNIKVLAEAEQMTFVYSIKSLVKWQMYTNCDRIKHPNRKKPNSTFLLYRSFRIGWFDGLMPKVAKCFLSISKMFIFNLKIDFICEKISLNLDYFELNIDPYYSTTLIRIYFHTVYACNERRLYEWTLFSLKLLNTTE